MFFVHLLDHNGIVVCDVPNHGSIVAFFEREYWSGWDLPFSYHHFTPASLELLVERHGLEIIGKKIYHCGCIKSRRVKSSLTRLVSSRIATLFPGTSVPFTCRKKEH